MNVPERPLSDAILDFAGPLIEALGPQPAPEEVRDALDAAVRLWNALIWASPVWERPDPKPLAAL